MEGEGDWRAGSCHSGQQQKVKEEEEEEEKRRERGASVLTD